jgi:hypothetical protein
MASLQERHEEALGGNYGDHDEPTGKALISQGADDFLTPPSEQLLRDILSCCIVLLPRCNEYECKGFIVTFYDAITWHGCLCMSASIISQPYPPRRKHFLHCTI